MSRQLKIRKPNATEMRQLRQTLEESTNARLCRWAEALLFYGAGLDAQLIADALVVHVNTIYTCLHRFAHTGTAFFQRLPRQGAPSRITTAQVDEIAPIAEQSPTEFGLPYGRWSLAKLRDYLIHQRRLKPSVANICGACSKKEYSLAPCSTQAHQPRSTALRDFGTNSGGLATVAAQWRDDLLRYQTHCREGVWWAAPYFSQTLGAGAASKDARFFLPVCAV